MGFRDTNATKHGAPLPAHLPEEARPCSARSRTGPRRLTARSTDLKKRMLWTQPSELSSPLSNVRHLGFQEKTDCQEQLAGKL